MQILAERNGQETECGGGIGVGREAEALCGCGCEK